MHPLTEKVPPAICISPQPQMVSLFDLELINLVGVLS